MIIREIKDEYDYAKVDCCDENKCKLRVDTGKNFVILKGESLVEQSKKICDCIIFHDDGKIALVELKSRHIDMSAIVDKLTNAGEKSLSIAKAHKLHKPSFFTILLLKSVSRYSHSMMSKNNNIKIQGQKYQIFFDKCGASLNDIFKKMAKRKFA